MSLAQRVFSHFSPVLKKVRSWLRTRGRNCSPSRAHPRRLLSWRSPSSGCGSSERPRWPDLLLEQTYKQHSLAGSSLVSRLCGTAKGMRREGSGAGTGTHVSPRLSSLFFLLGEELYGQPRAVYKYWAGGLRSCDHAATSSSISSSSTSVSVHRQSVGHPCYASVTGIRSATVQVRGAHRSPVMDVPVTTQLIVEVPQIPSSTECYRFQLCCRVVYVQCKLCKNRRCHSAVLGQVVHAPVVMLRQLL